MDEIRKMQYNKQANVDLLTLLPIKYHITHITIHQLQSFMLDICCFDSSCRCLFSPAHSLFLCCSQVIPEKLGHVHVFVVIILTSYFLFYFDTHLPSSFGSLTSCLVFFLPVSLPQLCSSVLVFSPCVRVYTPSSQFSVCAFLIPLLASSHLVLVPPTWERGGEPTGD